MDSLERIVEQAIAPAASNMERFFYGNRAEKLAFEKIIAGLPAAILAAIRDSGAVLRNAEEANWPATARVTQDENLPWRNTVVITVKEGEQIFGYRMTTERPVDRDFAEHVARTATRAAIENAASALAERVFVEIMKQVKVPA